MARNSKIQPLFVRLENAAKMLDMKPAEFRQLVECGSLPGPVKHDRWDVEQLASIMRGDAVKPHEKFEI
ncbi:hypothetical protein SAMN05421772_102277 [Paracoccus saliphilus]|uniref:Uncharacterized protein n=2 Tax=Paracoccus saliphilus TaxID=405559 RepID=A0AA45W296_9RHOB|nr:hypothetical protein JHX88_13425 [Paracoccus saliphilus]SIS65092.1 hypothetical protein SAMN05421772_102277 [Paracoccus saliphilus]